MTCKIDLPDMGYTPDNLRAVLQELGWTQQACADRLGVHITTVQNWIAPLDRPRRTDMPIAKWQELVHILQKKICNTAETAV